MKPSRLFAAVFCASGLFLAFPATAGANDVTTSAVSCAGYTFTWAHFPDTNVTLDVTVDYPNGTTSQGQTFTYGESGGTATGGTRYEGAGVAHMAVSWDLGGEHHTQATDSQLECVTPPTTVPTTDPPTTLAPPVTIARPQTLPVGTPELAYTGASWTLAGLGVAMVVAGAACLRRRA